MSNAYEISAKLNIDISDAKSSIKKAIDEIKKLETATKDINKNINKNSDTFNNNSDNIKDNTEQVKKHNTEVEKSAKTYAELTEKYGGNEKQLDRLKSGLAEHHKNNEQLIKDIEKTHKNLIDENATISKSNKTWREFAKSRGMVFNSRNLISSTNASAIGATLEDITKRISTVNDVSQDAIKSYAEKFHKLNQDLQNGMQKSTFESKLRELNNFMKREHGVTVKNLGNGYNELKSKTNAIGDALDKYNKVLAKNNGLMRKGNLSQANRLELISARDNVGIQVMGAEKYNNLLKSLGKNSNALKEQPNTWKYIEGALKENSHAYSNLNGKIKTTNSLINSHNNQLDLLGGKYSSVANKTGNYNKLLTTTTRSQRMQNYAMQVAGLRYNALGTSLGFVGGMLGTELVMGFASARIQSVKFDQQSKQMLKTSKLSEKGIQNLTKAVEDYTHKNRKINTQGLEYSIAQITKLNNLTEEQAIKIIPVVSDISNMMRINGRTQEEAILAVNDALDGQFKRLQEIGVGGAKFLKENYGWNGNIDDKMGLIKVLEKVGKKKGWHDLTKDVSTLQDAYDILGNTLDDVLTPAMRNVTPYLVTMIEGISDLISKLWNAPVAVQGLASAVGIAGIAFGKMKFEMLSAKILGSELIARLTGLDDGMYGITRSVGAVKIAFNEGALSFEEATRCLMDYHTTEIGAMKSFREYNQEMVELSALRNSYATELEYMSANQDKFTEAQILSTQQSYENTIAKRAELEAQRELDVEYARYALASKNLSAMDRINLDVLQKRFGLSKAELTHIAMKTGAINAETGALDANRIAQELGVKVEEMSGREKATYYARSQLMTLGIARENKALEAKARALYGLVPAEKIHNSELTKQFTKQELNNIANNLARRTYANLSTEQQKLTSVQEIETYVMGALNDLKAEDIELTDLQILAYKRLSDEQLREKDLLIETNTAKQVEKGVSEATTEAIALEGTARKLNTKTVLNNAKGTLESVKAKAKDLAATIALKAEFLLFNPVGWAVVGVVAILATHFYNVYKETSKTVEVFGKLKKASQEIPDKVQKINDAIKQLEETNKNGKNDERIAKLKKELKYYSKIEEKLKSITTMTTEKEANMDNVKADADTKYLNEWEKQAGTKKTDKYTYIDGLEKDVKNEYKEVNDFVAREEYRNKKFSDDLQKKVKDGKLTPQQALAKMREYVKVEDDVKKDLEKQLSDDWFEVLGGKWDEFWDRFKMFRLEDFADGKMIEDYIGFKPDDEWFYNTLIKPIFDPISNYLKDLTPQKLMDDLISNIPMLKPIDVGAELIKMLLPEPVSAEGNEGTPLLDRIKHDLGIDKLGEWITNDVEPKFKQLGDTVNYWLDINNWLQVAEGGADFITEWWNTNIVEPFNNLLHQFGLDLHADGATVGRKLKQGIKEGIGKLVEPVSSKVQEIVTYLTSGQAVNDAKNKAKDFAKGIYDGFKNGLGNPSKIITDEIGEIVKAITDKIDEVKKKAEELGKAVPDGVTVGTDHHSPGLGARIVLEEMEYIYGFVENYVPKIQSVSEKAGQAIANGISKHDITGGLNIVQNNQDIIKSNNMASQNTVQQYNTMSNTVDQSFGEMSDNATNDMQSVADQNAQYLSKMNTDTASNMSQINSIHKSKLNTMQSSTVTATNSMTRAWSSMRSSIVSSASHIQTQSYQKFNSLHRSISSFYKQIQSATFSAGNLVAGSPHRSVKFSTTRHSINSGVAGGYAGRSEDMAYTKLLKNLSRGVATNGDIDEFYRKYNVRCLNGDCYAGGINPNAHVRKQVNYAHKWKISDPKMYGIKLPMNNAVKDFDKGKQPRITYDNFEHYLGALLNARGFRGTYQFYFNSKRSNQQVWDDVRCNCYDGAELIMEIARDMGLSNVGMLHGDWKGIRHVCATVGGKVFDMTQFQNYGVFRGTPGVSFGGAGYTGRAIKWSPSGRFAGGSTTNTTNNKTNKVEVHIKGNTFIGMKEYKKQMEEIAQDVFYNEMSDNPCIGY